jgi:hypothetical protein
MMELVEGVRWPVITIDIFTNLGVQLAIVVPNVVVSWVLTRNTLSG